MEGQDKNPGSEGVLTASKQFVEEIQSAQTLFDENSSARSAVGAHIAGLDRQLADIQAAVKEIQAISMQVKMISFNASIEAARAGAVGKGFAVVATEIGRLSKNTDEVVANIGDCIASMGKMLADTTRDMDSAKAIGGEFTGVLTQCVEDARALDAMIKSSRSFL